MADEARYSLRLDRELLDKVAYIAGTEERSINSQIVILLRKYVNEYEDKNGSISFKGNK